MSWLTELLQRPAVTWWDVLDIRSCRSSCTSCSSSSAARARCRWRSASPFIVGLFYVSRGFQLETVNWLIRNIVGYVVFAAIVLMQADIRRALVHLGPRAALPALRARMTSDDETIEELVVAASTLSAKRTGAIIVIERHDRPAQLHRERHPARRHG